MTKFETLSKLYDNHKDNVLCGRVLDDLFDIVIEETRAVYEYILRSHDFFLVLSPDKEHTEQFIEDLVYYRNKMWVEVPQYLSDSDDKVLTEQDLSNYINDYMRDPKERSYVLVTSSKDIHECIMEYINREKRYTNSPVFFIRKITDEIYLEDFEELVLDRKYNKKG